MTEQTGLPRTIRAKVHKSAIGKVTRFFNATFKDTVTELFQNARRAGAKRIDVEIDGENAVITDDGRGIKDPAVLLCFGQSEWSSTLPEDPAGMGVYAMAHSGARIASKRAGQPGWRCELKPGHFTGELPAHVVPDDSIENAGTRVTVPLRDHKENNGFLADDARRAAVHLPVPVTVNGQEVERQHFLDRDRLPEDPFPEPASDQEFTIAWVKGGAGYANDHGSAVVVWADGFKVLVRHTWTEQKDPGLVNFQGQLIRSNALTVNIPAILGCWTAYADVSADPFVKLVLPARKEIVADNHTAELRERVTRSIFAVIARQTKAVALPHSVWLRGRATKGTGRWPAQPRTITGWTPRPADDTGRVEAREEETRTVHPQGLLMPELSPAAEIIIEHALERSTKTLRLYREEPRYKGYDWYDDLQRVTSVKVTYTDAGKRHVATQEKQSSKTPRRVRKIRVVLEVTNSDGAARKLIFPTNLAFTRLDNTFWTDEPDETGVLVDDGDPPDWDTLWSALMYAYFTVNEDSSDSDETQLDEFKEKAAFTATLALKGDREALKDMIRTCVHHNLRGRLPKDTPVTIVCQPDGGVAVEFGEQTAA
ncbi:MAG: hypothetical protein OXG35_22315 [Acidobacteria bacterium]|nr:hypothetical protein [Acidobacteriota bacterium]